MKRLLFSLLPFGVAIAQTAVLTTSPLNFGGATATVNYGRTGNGVDSMPMTVILSNSDAVNPLAITGITFTGANASELLQSNNCGASLGPSGTCMIVLTLHPTAIGVKTALLNITDNASDSPQTIAITATSITSQSQMSQVMTSTCQTTPNTPCSGTRTVQATSADTFIDSEGTLFDPTRSYYGFSKVSALNAGFRHVRSANTSAAYVANIKDLAAAGIKTQLVVSTDAGMFSADPSQFYSAQGQSTTLLQWLKLSFPAPISNIIDVVEGPNELNIEFPYTYWAVADHASNTPLCAYNNCGKWVGAYGVAYQQAIWNSLKGDPATADIKLLGPAPGYFTTSPFAVAAGGGGADLQGYADWGGCHPYATAGNGNGIPQTAYGGSAFYNAYTIAPAEEVDFAPQAWNDCNSSTLDGRGTVYGATPLAPSEQGYPTGTANGAVSEDVQARYYPRIYTEMFRHGMPRTTTYRFDDNCYNPSYSECNFGLIRSDLSLKPAYFAMKSLNNLLKEPGASFTPGSLTYSVSVGTNGAFTRTQYMHDLLLEKSNGEFYLLFWHEIAGVKKQNDDGSAISGPAVALNPLSLPVSFTFPPTIASAVLYTYDANYNLVSTPLTLSNNTVSLNATDTISILRVSPQQPPTSTTFQGNMSGSAFMQ
jgi:hypothetical protein